MAKESHTTPLAHDDSQPLLDAFEAGSKSADELKVGTEYENFGALRGQLEPMRYRATGSEASVEKVLRALQEKLGWREYLDDGVLIGLLGDMASVQLEPSGQLEFSGAPHRTIHAAVEEITAFERQKEALKEPLGVDWLWAGHHPLWRPTDFDLMPKQRYCIMRSYLPKRGSHARDMMHGTTTVQANLDYTSETNMGMLLRTAMGVSSILGPIFSNSPIVGRAPSGYQSFRNRIWEDVDSDRCGLLPWVFEGSLPTFEQYMRWAMQVPLFFIERDGIYLDCSGLPFDEYLKHGFQGHQATFKDWENHLSTLFPDVRLKTYLELRVADCVPPEFIPALPAISKGLMYHDAACEAAWDLVKGWSFSERVQHRQDAARDGLDARTPGGYKTQELANELLTIVTDSLKEQASAGGYADESKYVEGLHQMVREGETPATRTLNWLAAGPKSDAALLAHYQADWTDTFGEP